MGANSSSIATDEAQLRTSLSDLGQLHLISDWNAQTAVADKMRFIQQMQQLDTAYPGGVKSYVQNARQLLADSKAGVNPLAGWHPSVPDGETLEFGSDAYVNSEKLGSSELGGCAFVLVAGGLGERLGYSGIKVALPWQISSGSSYLELYIRSILALQQEASATTGRPVQLPLAIMVSDDTAARTEELLHANNNFGMAAGQVTLLKQEKVPCLQDNDARLALDPKDPFKIMTKPHGHGDVHFLLHSSGTLLRWEKAGMKWVYFFQDTNALAFKVLPATIGVSKRLGLEVNSVAVRRTPGESIGGLMRLRHQDGRQMTVNVEYNQIDALLKATVEPRGDVAGAGGFSPYPGSINQLLFALEPYVRQLEKSGGGMPEFVNPKYTDDTKTAFKAPTRLECMMQDYPKSLGPQSNVGFSVVSGAITFSPVKTNLVDARAKSSAGDPTYSAASGEADVYTSGCEMLAAAGVSLPPPVDTLMSGIKVALGPRVVIDPTFAVGATKWREKLPTPQNVKLSANSTLILEGELRGLRIESLQLSGTLILRLCAGANVTLKHVQVSNDGWAFKQLADGCEDEALAIRGYELQKTAQREMVFDKPGDYVIEDADDPSCSVP